MNPVEQIWAEKKEYDNSHPVKMVSVRAHESPNLNLSILKQNIDNIDGMNDLELWNFISRSYKSILTKLFQGEDNYKYIRQLQNPRVLDVFIRLFSNMRYIENDDIIRCNTLCYHYITLPKEQQKSEVVNRMLRLSDVVNKGYISSLLGLGLSNKLASMILIARFSDIDINVCVKRVNFIIITQPKDLMTDVMIEKIFRIIYDVMNVYYRIFPYLMMDVIPEYDDNNSKTWWVTEEVSEVDSQLGLAILNILDNLPSQLIRLTLVNYAEGQSMVHNKKPVRFSLNNLSEDYYRIKSVVTQLSYNESIMVP